MLSQHIFVHTLSLPDRDKDYVSKTKMEESLVVFLGGRVAEAVILKDISTGASSDIQHVTKTARDMVTKYGLTDAMGPIVYGEEDDEFSLNRGFGSGKNYSEKTAAEIDNEIRKIIDTAYEKCREIITKNIHYVHVVAQYLIKAETIDEDEFEKIMTDQITMEYVDSMDNADSKKTDNDEASSKETENDKAISKKADNDKSDSKKTDNDKSDSKEADNDKSDSKEADNDKSDSKKTDRNK